MRRLILVLVSVVVSAFFLALALRDVPLDRVWESIQRADGGWILMTFIFTLLSQEVRGVRWRILLDGRPPLARTIHTYNISTIVNQLPLRAGEVARTVLITRDVPLVTAATSVIVERLIDIVVIVALVAFSLSRLPDALPAATQTAALFGIAAVIGFIILILFARFPDTAHRLLLMLETRLPIVQRLHLRTRLEEILAGLKPMTSLRGAMLILFWTGVGWFFSCAAFWAVEQAFTVTEIDTWHAALLVVPLVAFSIAIPVTVASVGPLQGAVRVGGDAFGLDPVVVTSMGLVFHGVTVLTYAIIGVIGLWVLGVGFGEILRRKPQQEEM